MKKNKTKKSGQRNYLLWCDYVDKMTAMNIQPTVIDTGWQRADNNTNSVTK